MIAFQDDKLAIFGSPIDQGAVDQIENVMRDERAIRGALMADHHLGYSMPIGGVVAYDGAISPSGVGYDIACGNKAVRTNLNIANFGFDNDNVAGTGTYFLERNHTLYNIFAPFMMNIRQTISFGIGRTSGENIDHALFDNPIWTEIERLSPGLKHKAEQQLGTVGSGNHYVDVLFDVEDGQIWVANHFGSRGLGHTIATGFLNLAANKEFGAKGKDEEEPTVIDTDTDLGQFYIEAMNLAGEYAYAGRDYVADQVVSLLGAKSEFEVHNHHNFAWLEDGEWVIRKGATPLTTEPAFIGGSMGDDSVIVRGIYAHGPGNGAGSVYDIGNIGSAPHGAGRVMSRTQAAGKLRKMWYCHNQNCTLEPFRHVGENGGENAHPGSICPECGHRSIRKRRMRDTSTAQIDWKSVRDSLRARGIVVLGAGADEAPGVYKNLDDVLGAHSNIEILHRLRPIGVVMAGENEFDPYKD